MSREWQHGDVASCAGELVALSDEGWFWVLTGAMCHRQENVSNDARPLVVIDPEDREQVERLTELTRRVDRERPQLGRADTMQAALREFADPKPSKPEEPTGWGAVVEASDGWYWTLIAPDLGFWANYGSRGHRTYDEIDVVRIVGVGVTS